VRVAIIAGEGELQGLGGRGRTVLDREHERVSGASQVEIRVAPGVQIAGAAEALSGLCAGGSILAGVVGDDDGEVEFTLERAQVGEEGGDIAGAVFVDAMEAHEGVEHEQSRPEPAHGVGESRLIALEIEAKLRRGDDVEGELGEVASTMPRDAGESRLDNAERVFGQVDERAPRIVDFELAEAGGVGGDGEGHFEAEPALAALGRAAEDADARACPEPIDEPPAVVVGLFEHRGAHDGQRLVGGPRSHVAWPISSAAACMTASSRKA